MILEALYYRFESSMRMIFISVLLEMNEMRLR